MVCPRRCSGCLRAVQRWVSAEERRQHFSMNCREKRRDYRLLAAAAGFSCGLPPASLLASKRVKMVIDSGQSLRRGRLVWR